MKITIPVEIDLEELRKEVMDDSHDLTCGTRQLLCFLLDDIIKTRRDNPNRDEPVVDDRDGEEKGCDNCVFRSVDEDIEPCTACYCPNLPHFVSSKTSNICDFCDVTCKERDKTGECATNGFHYCSPVKPGQWQLSDVNTKCESKAFPCSECVYENFDMDREPCCNCWNGGDKFVDKNSVKKTPKAPCFSCAKHNEDEYYCRECKECCYDGYEERVKTNEQQTDGKVLPEE